MVGYFCSGGHTELGATSNSPAPYEPAAIDAFLRKIDPRITWIRQFPARRKPGPKLGRVSFRDQADGGVTGASLRTEMLTRLRDFARSASRLDAVVLIDDADCRFCVPGTLATWESDLTTEVRRATGRTDLPFIALLASPEIEAWMLADWQERFGGERAWRSHAHALARRMSQPDILGPRPWEGLEDFGCPYDPERGACTRKLSDLVEQVLRALLVSASVYSKRTHGPDMLRRLRPEVIAQTCRRVFAPALRRLQGLADSAAPPPAETPSEPGP